MIPEAVMGPQCRVCDGNLPRNLCSFKDSRARRDRGRTNSILWRSLAPVVVYGGTTEEEMTIIRMEIGAGGLTVSRGQWITIDRATGQQVH